MTSFAIARRRVAEHRHRALTFAGGHARGAGRRVYLVPGARRAERSVSIQLSPAKTAALVAATSASPAEIRAVGEQAKLINAALPFSTSPIQSAQPSPFAATTSTIAGRCCA